MGVRFIPIPNLNPNLCSLFATTSNPHYYYTFGQARMMADYGVFVIYLVHQFMGAIGRQCSVVNLDPANDQTNYPCALDIRDLVTLEEIMADDRLGPNGGILYALEELEHNMEWLENGLKELGDDYILFDCPGQVELYTHHNSLRNIFFRLQKFGYRVGPNVRSV